MAARVRLVHWDEDEGLERQRQLEALGVSAAYDFADGIITMRMLRSSPPDAVVIDLTRMPSHGREVARALRGRAATRHVPLVFVGGEPEKVKATRALLPDATYTTWGRIKTALPRALARPVKNPVVPSEMSAKPAVLKLGVKPGHKVALLGSPTGFAATLKPLPSKVRFTARPEADANIYLCFARTARELQAHLLAASRSAGPTLWLIWPKKASGVASDLDGNVVRLTGLAAGWVDFKVCAVNDTWSGLAFKRRRTGV
jgi:CheY-like chemotaxis protein